MQYLWNENIPLLIFSAGLANVLKEFLMIKGVYHPNIHVVSNLMTFDPTGALLAFEGEMIHSMNKNAHILKKVGADWAHDEKRKNILLVRSTLSFFSLSLSLCVYFLSISLNSNTLHFWVDWFAAGRQPD